MTQSSNYRGRFAPSPTGPLHLGSLVAALASYLDARSVGGQWLLRIEDLDTPRTVRGSADMIQRQLESHGLLWDEQVFWQGRRDPAYRVALAQLEQQELIYPCACSRAELAAAGHKEIYPGTCAGGLSPGQAARALRLRVAGSVQFADRGYAEQNQDLPRECGDFVIRRADGLFAYQLAVVVDDAFQGITHVVRGLDLLNSTPRQIYLQQALGLPTPVYLHLPLVLDSEGRKLAKQSGAAALLDERAEVNLLAALEFLGLRLPQEFLGAGVAVLLAWALKNWRVPRIAGPPG